VTFPLRLTAAPSSAAAGFASTARWGPRRWWWAIAFAAVVIKRRLTANAIAIAVPVLGPTNLVPLS
jgi:multisubunit Na+/H+ antiporter MnhE subunit